MSYALQHTDTQAYVARPGSEHAYTRDLTRAAVYATREEAERNRCATSERVIDLQAILRPTQ